MEEVFFPNSLTKDQVKNLDGWKLKVAALHFGATRRNCVRGGYGYVYRLEKVTDIGYDYFSERKPTVILVADKNGKLDKPLSLRNEVNWNNYNDLLAEQELDVENILRDCISGHITPDESKD
jgi:hypothetical protein